MSVLHCLKGHHEWNAPNVEYNQPLPVGVYQNFEWVLFNGVCISCDIEEILVWDEYDTGWWVPMC